MRAIFSILILILATSANGHAMPNDLGGVRQRFLPMTVSQYALMSGQKEDKHMQTLCVAKYGENFHYSGMIEDRREDGSQMPQANSHPLRNAIVDMLPGGKFLRFAVSLDAAIIRAVRKSSTEAAMMTTVERPYVAICTQSDSAPETVQAGNQTGASSLGQALYSQPATLAAPDNGSSR